MLNPTLLNEEQKTDIMTQFSQLVDRGILDINQDLNDPIRQEFERVVLDAFGIGEYYDNVVESLKAMRRIRKAVTQRPIVLRALTEAERYNSLDDYQISIAAEGGIEN